jgi:2-dehydro-3-deoxyphosphogluconate aldolase/(4S)-4-hydroxy-2-oxoglutarate aldolase
MKKEEDYMVRDNVLEGRESMGLNISVVGILRGVAAGFFGDIMHAAFAAGLEAIEITMNTEHAEKIVAALAPDVPAGKYLGMGTIRNLEEAVRAAASGAMFFVTPNVDISVIEFARGEKIPVIAGGLTPTEVYSAWSHGAAMIKVFPCSAMGGAGYIKDLLGPLGQVKMMAVGGVTYDNVADYFSAGASAVGVSTALFGKEALMKKDINCLAENVKKFLQKCPGK